MTGSAGPLCRISPAEPAQSRPADPATSACREIDDLLFQPSGWFAIDTRNTRLKRVTPGTLDQGLALVGRGDVATIVGQLRPGIVAIDIDAAGELGNEAVEALRSWCAVRNLWHLQRASGGGPGRWHLFIVPGVRLTELELYVAEVRRSLRLSGKHLDLRRQMRPLSAPHRRTGATACPPALETALTSLQDALQTIPDRITTTRRPAPTPAPTRRRGGPDAPLKPLRRPQRALDEPWAAYVTRGRAAAAAVDRDPSTRSQIELEATFQLVICGYSEEEAWNTITTAPASAFTKARAQGRRWWWYVWNRCVVDADDWLRSRRSTIGTAEPLPSTEHVRSVTEAVWRTWPARTRHTDREVLLVILARMDRSGSDSVPVPQRDLVLDCAVSSRTTVRSSLTRLQSRGLLHVMATYRPGTTDTAHTISLPPPVGTEDGVLSVIDPSRFQPPQPGLPLRRGLGLAACALLQYLPAPTSSAGGELLTLALAAGLIEQDQQCLTERQLRSVRSHLQALGQAGLAYVDEHGRWRSQPQPVPYQHLGGLNRDQEIRAHIATERAEFRTRFDAKAKRLRWEERRREVLAREAKAARARQKAWWDEQPAEVRLMRSSHLAHRFASQTVQAQTEQKYVLAEYRARAGENERARHDAWIADQSTVVLDGRSIARSMAFSRRPPHEQQQLVAAWTQHRAQWRLPYPIKRSGHTSEIRSERELLQRPSPTVEELTLFDVGSAGPVASSAIV